MKITTEKVELSKIVIPDLWKIAQIEELKGYTLGGKTAKELIIEGWHMAHDLKKQLEAQSELLEACKAAEFAIRREKELQSERGESVAVDLGFAHSKILAAITKAEGNA